MAIIIYFKNNEINNPIYMTVMNLIQKGYFWQFWFFGSLIIMYLALLIKDKYFKQLNKYIMVTIIFIVACLTIDLISVVRCISGKSILQIHIRQTFRLWTWFAYYLLGGLLGREVITDKIFKKINLKLNWIIVFLSLGISNIYQYNMAKLYKTTYAEYFYDNIFTFLYIISLFILILRVRINMKSSIIKLISKNMIGIYNTCNYNKSL